MSLSTTFIKKNFFHLNYFLNKIDACLKFKFENLPVYTSSSFLLFPVIFLYRLNELTNLNYIWQNVVGQKLNNVGSLQIL